MSFEGIDFIDSQGSAEVGTIQELADSYGAELRLARVKPEVLDVLRLDGVVDAIGEDRIYGNLYRATADKIPGEQAG